MRIPGALAGIISHFRWIPGLFARNAAISGLSSGLLSRVGRYSALFPAIAWYSRRVWRLIYYPRHQFLAAGGTSYAYEPKKSNVSMAVLDIPREYARHPTYWRAPAPWRPPLVATMAIARPEYRPETAGSWWIPRGPSRFPYASWRVGHEPGARPGVG